MAPARGASDDAAMTLTVIGQVLAPAGLVQEQRIDGPVPYVTKPGGYLREQPAPLALCLVHDRSDPVGVCVHLERSRKLGLMAVARVPDPEGSVADLLSAGDWWLSDSVSARPIGGFEFARGRLNEISLVPRTANLGTRPVRWSRTDIAVDGGAQPRGLPLGWHDTWARAHERMASYTRRRADRESLTIVDLDPLGVVDGLWSDPAAARRVAATPRPTPTPPVTHVRRGSVRLDGRWLDEAQSARVLAAIEADADGTLSRSAR
jgi:hypothetical protein